MKKFLPVRLVAVVACLSLVSCSVSIPDASYIDAAQEGFSNTAYPANRITGEWFNFNTGTAQYRASGGRETRIEYHFHAGGSGTVRQTSQFHRGDGKMDDGDSLVVIKAPIRWSYLSPNMRKVLASAGTGQRFHSASATRMAASMTLIKAGLWCQNPVPGNTSIRSVGGSATAR